MFKFLLAEFPLYFWSTNQFVETGGAVPSGSRWGGRACEVGRLTEAGTQGSLWGGYPPVSGADTCTLLAYVSHFVSFSWK